MTLKWTPVCPGHTTRTSEEADARVLLLSSRSGVGCVCSGVARDMVPGEPGTPALGRAHWSRPHQPATRQASTSQVARMTAEGFGRMFVKPRMGATRSMSYLERPSCWSDASENGRMILLLVAKFTFIILRRERSFGLLLSLEISAREQWLTLPHQIAGSDHGRTTRRPLSC